MFTGIHFEIENEGDDINNETISLSDVSYHSGVLRPQIQIIDDHNLLNLTSADLDSRPTHQLLMVGNEDYVEEIDVLQDEVVSHKNTACKTDSFSLSSESQNPLLSDLFDHNFPEYFQDYFSPVQDSNV